MPLYEFGCPQCGVFERYLPVSEYDSPQTCKCGEVAQRQISKPYVFVKSDCHYQSPIDGRLITSYAQRKEDLARSGCVEYDPGVKQDYQRRIEREDKELDKAVDETIEAAIEKMPSRKLEKLDNELRHCDVEVTRITPTT